MAAQRVYSTQFVYASDGSSYSFNCPEGYTLLLSCIDVYIGIVTDGGNFTAYYDGEHVFWSQGYDVPGEQNSRWRGKIVLTYGHYFEVQAGDVFSCLASGDLFLNPPS